MKKTLFYLAIFQISLALSQNVKESEFQWQAPGGQYINPTSFFSMHGYVNAVYANTSKEWTNGNFNGIGMPGQLLVPNRNNASFTGDQALWISSEISENTQVTMELHLVSSPSGNGAAGPGGLTIVMTEANSSWKIIPQYLTVAFGSFWTPFGKVNTEWLGAQNLFSLVPQASGAYITHYNEKGVRITGYLKKSIKTGLNYAVSYGNGFNAFDVSGYNSWDLNENKTVNARVGLFPGFGKNMEIGFSACTGDLSEGNASLPASNINSYRSNINAYGIDFMTKLKGFKLKGYYIYSEKGLLSDQNHQIFSNGVFGEVSYTIPVKHKFAQSIVPKFRIDHLKANSNISAISDYEYTGYSYGINVKINERFTLSVDHNILNETQNFDNNRLIARVSAEF